MKLLLLALIAALILTGCSNNNDTKEIKMLKEKIAQFAPVEIKYDSTLLTERQRMVVRKLFEASQIIDTIYLNQVYSKNREIKYKLENSSSEVDKLKLKYFDIMFGPFDRLDHNKPFIGDEQKPKGANFYPEDMTKEEFNNWIKANPQDDSSFTSSFTVIRRENGKLTAIPYSEFYKTELTKAAALLKEAAEFADNQSLKKYLTLIAKAFETNNYFDSDMAWMDLKNNKIEVIIGPYEVYEDELFNYKASYESFVTIKDSAESEKLQKFGSYLKDIEDHLPIEDKYKNTQRGNESPIVVVNEVYSAGDTKAGVQTLAFNLPNDERVRKAKGSKKVMLKNISDAKFEKQLIPISKIVLDSSQLPYITFNAFFSHALMHEMSHGVGPGFITVNGRKTEVSKELKETYSTIEECKADVLGMYNNIFMIDKGLFPKTFSNETWTTFLAGIFRSVRFGITEAHGSGNAIIYNYLLEKGGYEYNPETNKVKVNFDKIYGSVKELAHILLTIEATGNYDGAKELIKKYAVISPSMKTLIDKLSGIPVDIKPVFQIEEDMK
ncbi:MAG: peptidase [Ignavibacteriaceae bacterium]